MNLDVQLDLSILQDLNALAAQVEDATETGLDAVAERGLELKQGRVEETYVRPESPGTTRTGAFRDGQTIESEPGVRRIGVRGRAEAYEPRLQVLATGRDGINRSNPAAANAHRDLEAEAPEIFERAMREALE